MLWIKIASALEGLIYREWAMPEGDGTPHLLQMDSSSYGNMKLPGLNTIYGLTGSYTGKN